MSFSSSRTWIYLLFSFFFIAMKANSEQFKQVHFFMPITHHDKLGFCVYESKMAEGTGLNAPRGEFGNLPQLIKPDFSAFPSKSTIQTKPIPVEYLLDSIIERSHFQSDQTENNREVSVEAITIKKDRLNTAKKNNDRIRVAAQFAQIPVRMTSVVLSLQIMGSFLSGNYLESGGLFKSFAVTQLGGITYVLKRKKDRSKTRKKMIEDASQSLFSNSLVINSEKMSQIILDNNPNNDFMVPIAKSSEDKASMLCDLKAFLDDLLGKGRIEAETHTLLLQLIQSFPIDESKLKQVDFLSKEFLQLLVHSFHELKEKDSSFYKSDSISLPCPELAGLKPRKGSKTFTFDQVQDKLHRAEREILNRTED